MVAQKNQLATDSHHLVEYDPRVTEFPDHSYVLFIPDRSDKLVPRHRDPNQVMSHAGAVYTIQDLVNDKVVMTHIHNLRPFTVTTTPSTRISLQLRNRTPKNS